MTGRIPPGFDSLETAPLHRGGDDDPLRAARAAWFPTRAGDRARIVWARTTLPCRGSVVLCVGRSEFAERYAEVVGELLARGFSVLLHEWLGQGLSGRLARDPMRAHMVGGWQRQIAALDEILGVGEASMPRPWVAVGHSMGGGLLAVALAEGETRFAAAVLNAPMIGFHPGRHTIARIRTVSRLMLLVGAGERLPRRQIDPATMPFASNRLTHDPVRFARVQALLRAHPELALGEPSWGWVAAACDIERRLARPGAAEGIACPVAIATASEDAYVDNASTERFHARLLCGELVETAGAYHSLFAETDALRAPFWALFDRTVAALPDRTPFGTATGPATR